MIHIVFDLDGTLADTQRIHQKIESDFLLSKWVMIEDELIGKIYAGRSPTEWIPECLTEHSVNFHHDEIEEFVSTKDARVIALLWDGEIELMPWVFDVLTSFAWRWIKMGISSGACREFIDEFIVYFHLDMIEASKSANEVEHKKPAPDVFLSSFWKLEELHGKPDVKWVVWDGRTDIIGWRAAWAKTILCYNEYDIPYDAQIAHFGELTDII